MQRIAAGENFGEALIANDREYLVQVKANPGMYTLVEAQQLADDTMSWAKGFLKQYQENHPNERTQPQEELFNNVLAGALRTYWEGEWQQERVLEDWNIDEH